MKKIKLFFWLLPLLASPLLAKENASGLSATADTDYKYLGSVSSTASMWSPTPFEKNGAYFAGGQSPRLADKALARQMALKNAAEQAAGFLEKQGLGPARDIQLSVENAVLHETTHYSKALGKSKIKVEGIVQDRWQAPDGTDVWSVRAMISIRRKK